MGRQQIQLLTRRRANSLKRILFFLLLIIASCKGQTNKNEIKREKHLQDKNLVVQIPNRVYVNKESCVNLFFGSGKCRIECAYVDCNIDSIKIDSVGNIIGCHQKLYQIGDTIKVCLTPVHIGNYNFHTITLVFRDIENNYYASDTSFSLNVQL